jgi:hypothetical protein
MSYGSLLIVDRPFTMAFRPADTSAEAVCRLHEDLLANAR